MVIFCTDIVLFLSENMLIGQNWLERKRKSRWYKVPSPQIILEGRNKDNVSLFVKTVTAVSKNLGLPFPK